MLFKNKHKFENLTLIKNKMWQKMLQLYMKQEIKVITIKANKNYIEFPSVKKGDPVNTLNLSSEHKHNSNN